MASNIKGPEADRLARALAEATGETLTEAVANALRERLDRARCSRSSLSAADEIDRIAHRIVALPVLDVSHSDQILGYDEPGLPT